MPQSNINNAATEERAQPWQTMQEVQNLFKPETSTTPGANAESAKDEDEPLKLNLFRTNLNSARTNIANVKDEVKEQ